MIKTEIAVIKERFEIDFTREINDAIETYRRQRFNVKDIKYQTGIDDYGDYYNSAMIIFEKEG